MENGKITKIISQDNQLISNLVHSVDKKVFAAFNREFAAYGVTMQQAISIMMIAKNEETHIYQKDIEKYLNLTNPSVTSLMSTLIHNGYVYKVKDEKDGRYYHLHLTEKANAIVDDLAAILDNTNIYVESILDEAEYEVLFHALKKIETKMDALLAAEPSTDSDA